MLKIQPVRIPSCNCTCRETFRKYVNYETGKYVLDKMQSIKGMSLGAAVSEEREKVYESSVNNVNDRWIKVRDPKEWDF